MRADIQFSVSDSLVLNAKEDRDEGRRYLEKIGEECDSVELFISRPPVKGPLDGFINKEQFTDTYVNYLQDLGLKVESAHATPMHGMGSEREWRGCLEKIEDAQSRFTGDESERSYHTDLRLMTFHPPRFSVRHNPDIDTRREMLVSNLAQVAIEISDSEDIDTTVTVENVCPRGSFEYLLVTPEDARKLRKAAEEVELKPDAEIDEIPEFLYFTLDVGHADEPLRMLGEMRPIQSVHIHGTVEQQNEAKVEEIRERYSIPADEDIGVSEPGDQYQHLPPQATDLPITDIYDRLDDRGYKGPIVVELDYQYREPQVVGETVDYLRSYL